MLFFLFVFLNLKDNFNVENSKDNSIFVSAYIVLHKCKFFVAVRVGLLPENISFLNKELNDDR